MTDDQAKIIGVAKAYKRVFASDDGHVVLDDLKKKCRYDTSSLPADRNQPIDLHRILVDEAQWQVVNHIVRQIEKNLDDERPTETQTEKE